MLFSTMRIVLCFDFWFWCSFVMQQMMFIRRLQEDGSLIGVFSMENSKIDEQLLQMSKSWDIVGKSWHQTILYIHNWLWRWVDGYYLFVYLWILWIFSLSFWQANFGWILVNKSATHSQCVRCTCVGIESHNGKIEL